MHDERGGTDGRGQCARGVRGGQETIALPQSSHKITASSALSHPSISTQHTQSSTPSSSPTLNMTDSIEWKWDVLHAPVSALVEAEVRLPRAPPQAAPLNVGSWFIQLSEDDKGQWELSLRAVGLTVQPRSLDFEYEITSPKGDNSIGGKLEGGSLSGLSETEWDWDIGEGKDGVFGEDEAQIELRVVCPDLQKPSRRSTAQAATAHIGRK